MPRALLRLFLITIGGLIFCVMVVAVINAWIIISTSDQRYHSAENIPRNDVALVLGTVPHSEFLQNRITAAIDLYQARKVRHLLLSGYRENRYYDEPSFMRDALLEAGIPAAAITLDPYGFRTLDSVVRAREVYGLKSCTIVSQEFHNSRALLIARKHGLDAVALNAPDPTTSPIARARIREVAARLAALLDLYLFSARPRKSDRPRPITFP